MSSKKTESKIVAWDALQAKLKVLREKEMKLRTVITRTENKFMVSDAKFQHQTVWELTKDGYSRTFNEKKKPGSTAAFSIVK